MPLAGDTSDLLSGKRLPEFAPVPSRYCGVWTRTLLETPQLRDDSTTVRWMQLSHWHADLRIPAKARATQAGASPLSDTELHAVQQGFCGITEVSQTEAGEVCTWHRLIDYQPPEPVPDAGQMVFSDSETIEEIGIHSTYREIWQRLPGSTSCAIAFNEPALPSSQISARWLIAGRYAMRVRQAAHVASPVEISFGQIDSGQLHVQHSTWPELESQRLTFSVNRENDTTAVLQIKDATLRCEILEWNE